MNTLIERKARVTVKVTRTEGDETIATTYEFIQHRMSITVTQGGGQYGNAKVQIFGAALDAMNNIARLWLEVLSPSNNDTLDIDVWDGANFVPFFHGVITWSAINASGAPNVALEIEANDAMAGMNMAAPPYSQDTPIALKDALETILAPTGFQVEIAESVPFIQIEKVYFLGSPMEQANKLMNCFPELSHYTNLQRFIVRPVNGPLGGDPLPINKGTGMIGYPTYSSSGVTLAHLFDARLRLGLALDIQTTSFDFINRTKWVCSVLQHNIQPNWPGGQWVTQLAAQAYGTKGNDAGSLT